MLAIPLLLAALVVANPPVHNGRSGETKVKPPRAAAELVIDGKLDEPVWKQAAVLTGFSQFSPQDGIAASDSTQVLVWYSATAIHFGVRAYEPHGNVRATLAERDRIGTDDQVQFLIGTFNDGRQAVMFAVNPFGIQADGSLVEQGNRSGGFMSGGGTAARESADLSQDYVFQSKGRLTERGYEVEVTIPFKSLRFQSVAEQTWGFNVVRRVQHSNYEDSWTPAQRANASFLAQSGTLGGLTDLHRGMVLDVTPELTDRVDGAPGTQAWDYATGKPQLGATVRWGITNNLTFNGTFNPDFSQVEADVNQVNFDPRRQLFFPERRPFFIDGIEQFQTPNGLVYTRRMVRPEAAAKVAGKVGATNVAYMTAVDDRTTSASGANPFFNILRVSRDLGSQSRLGLTYTDRIDGDDNNRVLSLDGRAVTRRIYSGSFQLAAARNSVGGVVNTSPLFEARLARDGRAFGLRGLINGIDPDFVTRSGFISRPGEVHANIQPRYTWFFERGSRMETFTGSLNLDNTWNYDNFMVRGDARDKKFHVNTSAQLRGGWTIGASLLVETFGYDPSFYASRYRIEAPDGLGRTDTLAFVGTPRLPNRDWVASFTSPRFKYLQASVSYVWGQDENFFEWASADIKYVSATLNIRPSERIRVDATYQYQDYTRRTDGSLVGITRNPRIKLEYQVSRPFFIRIINEYVANATDALRDDSRTGYPLLQRNGAGTYVRTTAGQSNSLRSDLLLAYTPQPGTVIYLGYGARMLEPLPFRYERLERQTDAVFVKLSYLFRR